MTPTARSLKLLRDTGWTADVVERFNWHTKRRNDFLGFADIIACRDSIFSQGRKSIERGTIVAIQATSGSNVASRIKKIVAEPRALAWIKAGGRVEVWGWRKLKIKRGGKATRWACAHRRVMHHDIPSETHPHRGEEQA